jgi:hypothetical protein
MTSRAYLVNFTGFSGHWGMFGTSLALALGLAQRGYSCDYLGVDEIAHTWQGLSDGSVAPPRGLVEADIVVVNGEGTLHGNRSSAHNLLRLTTWISSELRKPVFMINCGYFPGHGPRARDPQSLSVYEALERALAFDRRSRMVVRDRESLSHAAAGYPSVILGGDLLPLVLEALPKRAASPSSRILVTGSAGLSPRSMRRIGTALSRLAKDSEVVYLSGGWPDFVNRDQDSFAELAAVVPTASFVAAETFLEFCSLLQSARLLVSGRFHYAIAALYLGTPVAVWRSNTPKNEVLLSALGRPGAAPQLTGDGLDVSLTKALIRRPITVAPAVRRAMAVDARPNLRELPCGGAPRSPDLAERMALRLGVPLSGLSPFPL